MKSKKQTIGKIDRHRRWVYAPPMPTLFKLVFLVIAIVLAVAIVHTVKAQDCSLWIYDEYPAPSVPYVECPEIEGIDVTDKWTAWKAGENHLFDSYRQPLRFVQVDAVWMAIQKHKTLPTLIYVGWGWDESQTTDNILVGHPSCGVYLQERQQ